MKLGKRIAIIVATIVATIAIVLVMVNLSLGDKINPTVDGLFHPR